MSDMLCDVAIIGYGPTVSLLLGEKGYRVTVFERWPHLYPMPLAEPEGSTTSARTRGAT
jgi:2-polyprenyl-6-methoxyphenol hydroxylase-like FAD-dependent oxidoreductase